MTELKGSQFILLRDPLNLVLTLNVSLWARGPKRFGA